MHPLGEEGTGPAVVPGAPERRSVLVEGIVQGVGFRPYVFALATALGLTGSVGNDSGGVHIEVEGDPERVAAFCRRLPAEAPPLAVVERVETQPLPLTGDGAFVITGSTAVGRREALVSPDVATCDDCLRELWDPVDRRYRHPFVNCTNCGPRYTIVRDVPYDRATTTMAAFDLCAACRREYDDPADRRFHAQPVCCPACGPRLRLVDARGEPLPGDAIARAADELRAGRIVAVKSLGGYHLAARADEGRATTALRERKHREDKPFALMVADIAAARALCTVGPDEAALLADPARPIVLLRRRPDAAVAPAVAPGNRWLGLMLPSAPVHHLLLAAVGVPLVMTSGNVSDEPITYRDDDAHARLGGIADVFLTHDRPIHLRVDDSIARVSAGRTGLLRRARGFAPRPVSVRWPFPRPVLATGAELKSTVCVARGHRAFVSQHLGDLENYEVLRSFTATIEHLTGLFDVRPEVVAHDLHPEYLSTKHAHDVAERAGIQAVGVQHHHAHVAACLADVGEDGPVIGVAFDGTGYGTDGTIWGGEVLVADLAGFTRVGHLETVGMPGGAAAIREPWRMALAHLDAAFDGDPPEGLGVRRRQGGRWDAVGAVLHAGVNSPTTSSMGRLLDAAAAILGVRDTTTYEGQAAIELEQLADPAEHAAYAVSLTDDTPFRIRGADLVRAVVEDLARGAERPAAAARVHAGLAGAVIAACRRVRETHGLATVALSGGVFQNALLTEQALRGLTDDGFRVLTHVRVPPNDGGISLGQAVVAAARDRAAS